MEITYASPSYTDLSTAAGEHSSDVMPTSATRPVKVIPLQHPSTTASASSSTSGLPGALFSRWTSKVQSMTWMDWLELLLPCSRWIRTYKWREYLQIDVMAGTTIGIMLVPQVCLFSCLARLLRKWRKILRCEVFVVVSC